MYTYSKKSRRRMHAIPAAAALLTASLLWLALGSHAQAADTLQPLASDEPSVIEDCAASQSGMQPVRQVN
ncbi:MAG: hypothetical protein CMI08_18010 [Oceanospirillaceae bacterium]|uniref:hypothetical protein n=1 Tax=unclassified Thalassolituus TaxID=2624967 RepID=UPI000C0955F8|nr:MULTISPECIES: hypothetical protein [unclassified Thalassolituus]MAK92191.1 hypothetical protein [Thalassolituus sp.]MAS26085.1 hypothetical protein [Oceanospirillaceae bacterium]MAY01062.1 hypothetical protein [Oceanospirillaceae bacterium]MBL36558.1 hypothetical protein [Oceanospirillaceae bacterium]MBS53374.1 hypothetical protein [Oceanospirillaceae bacterium]|tara:strand:+ start:2369 stop:2578 length:210 start_codon:yes stop_codon:yes gene_type:complete